MKEGIEVINKIKSVYSEKECKMLLEAYEFAKEAHSGQKRVSGEDYFIHPIAVASILIDLSMDSNTIAAAFLHDVLEDTSATTNDIKERFGEEILDLVEGVTKLEKIEFKSKEEEQAENFKKLFVSMAKDIRVIIIKLADRLHNMRSLNFLSKERQIRMANETLEIYAPLAGRLGISNIKCELEDLSLKYIDPDAYEYLAENIRLKQSERREFIDQIVSLLNDLLVESNIKGEVYGRPKHFYSIYKKMKTQNKTLEQIYDLTAVRVLVNSVDECYEVLGKIHKRWSPIPGRIKDYIAMPKDNMYQSLHTTVITSFGQVFEIQIRTFEMNKIAEFGIAAHWQYKERKVSADSFDKRLSWIREVMEWQGGLKDSKEFIESIKGDVYNSELLVFTPKGEVMSLAKDSTPIDFAYKIHTEVGNKCVGARVNGKMVPLSTPLQVGDVVEIITSNNSKGPTWDWLKIVKTSGAKAKIKAYYKKQMADDMIKLGKSMLEAEAKSRGLNLSDILTNKTFEIIEDRFSFSDFNEMYTAVGCGAITSNQIISKLSDIYKRESVKAQHYATTYTSKVVHSNGDVVVKGVEGLLVKFARCCSPVPGDNIVGFITRGRGVVIHQKDCPNLKNEDPERIVEAKWTGKSGVEGYTASIRIMAHEEALVLALLSNECNKHNLFILAINGRIDNKNHIAIVDVTLKLEDTESLENMIKDLKKEKNIYDVYRNNN